MIPGSRFIGLVPVLAVALVMGAFGVASMSGAAASTSRSSGAIPEVYVGAGNSFIVTVPNLTKVAIGDPRHFSATVVSPTEVLVQANPNVGMAGVGSTGGSSASNGNVDFVSGDLYVWSGDRRYVYRVVVIETTDAAFLRANGMARLEVEPDKILVWMYLDESANASSVERNNPGLISLKALGLKYEVRVMRVASGMTAGGLDSATVSQAISRHTVLEGMTVAELERSLGPLPPVYRTVVSDTSVIDYYSYANHEVGVSNGYVVRVLTLDQIPEPILREAVANRLPMIGMTENQLVDALGAPRSEPVARVEYGVVVRDFIYPGRTVTVTQGRVTNVVSSNPALPTEARPEYQYLGLITDPLYGVIEGRAYRLNYLSGSELEAHVTQLLASLRRIAPYSRGSKTEGLYTIYADTTVLGMVDNLARVLDRPDQKTPVEVVRTQYDVGETTTAGFLMARFAPSVGMDRVEAAEDALRVAISALPTVPGVPVNLTAAGRTFSVSGVPEQVNFIDSMLATLVPDIVGREIDAAIRSGEIIVGMSRRQVEAALGVRLDNAAGLRHTNGNGFATTDFQAADRLLRFSEDLLVEWSSFPNADQVRNARSDKKILYLMARADVEAVLGERPRRTTRAANGTEESEYAFGKGVYWNDRLLRMSDLFGSEMRRLGITVLAPYNVEQEFQLLAVEEQQSVIRRGIVMRGMTERDVQRATGETPFSIRPGTLANERVHTYSNYVVLFRDGIAYHVNTSSSGAPRILALKSRRAEDVASMIRASFANANQMAITADTISNRLIIRATAEQYADVERFALALDQQEIPQVLIEAKFVQMSRATARQLGVQWGLSTQADAGNRPFAGFSGTPSRTDPANQPASNVRTGLIGEAGTTQTINQGGDGGLILGMLGGNGFSFSGLRYTNVDLMLAAMESKGDVDVLSSPRIATVNGQQARLEAINRVYDITTTQTVDPVSGLTTFSVTPTERQIGITLDVTPTVGQDGIITLDIEATSASPSGPPLELANGTVRINQIAERNARTRVMVRSGTPLVMGGLAVRQSEINDRRVPGLGSLPLIGRLFRAESRTNQDDDLLIFLTARVAPPDGSVSAVDRVTTAVRPEIPNPTPSYAAPATSGASGQ